MNNIGTELGNEIRRIRRLRGMNQEELAFKAGISAAHLGQIERALKNPTVETVYNIASALDVSLQELFSFSAKVNAESETRILENKIKAYISSMNEEEKRDIFKIIKLFKKKHN